MSENAKHLLQRLIEDESVRKELASCTNPDELASGIVALGQTLSLPVTEDEVRAFLAAPAPVSAELSDDQLEVVSGGKYDFRGDSSLGSALARSCLGDYTSDVHNDRYEGNENDNKAWGGFGNDYLDGGEGNDTLEGGHADVDGNDTLLGGAGNDSISGGAGDDLIYGGADNDTVYAGSGTDVVEGGSGNDMLAGEDGHDILRGGTGDDVLDGGRGDDLLEGGQGNDILMGGEGDDYLDGGEGNDTLAGGAGTDTFVFGQDDGADTITDFNPEQDKLHFSGLTSQDQIGVSTQDGNTVITYGQTTITIEDQQLTAEQVWNLRT